jgi:hypothetical protein
MFWREGAGGYLAVHFALAGQDSRFHNLMLLALICE